VYYKKGTKLTVNNVPIHSRFELK